VTTDPFLLEQIDRTGSADLKRYSYRPARLERGICKEVAAAMRERNLALIVGAGISYPSKVPTWNELIDKAGKSAFGHTDVRGIVKLAKKSHLSPSGQVRLFENLLGVRSAFRIHLSKALYAERLPGLPQSNLVKIARFILGTQRAPRISTVITYNFDDLLEVALRHVIAQDGLKAGVRSVYSEESYNDLSPASMVSVYHPHGYLPPTVEAGELTELPIVFSEPDYHSHFLNYAFWANTLQMSVFSSKCCLFLGLSFSDSNLRRLLDYTRAPAGPRHVALRARSSTAARGVSRHLEDYIVERDLHSLGVKTLWIKSYDRVSYALNKILCS
jgi:hypothetical protein